MQLSQQNEDRTTDIAICLAASYGLQTWKQ